MQYMRRTHIYVHGLHYPSVLMDWWMDDWISTVYGPDRTKRIHNVLVRHHIAETQNKRYSVNREHLKYLRSELTRGRCASVSLCFYV